MVGGFVAQRVEPGQGLAGNRVSMLGDGSADARKRTVIPLTAVGVLSRCIVVKLVSAIANTKLKLASETVGNEIRGGRAGVTRFSRRGSGADCSLCSKTGDANAVVHSTFAVCAAVSDGITLSVRNVGMIGSIRAGVASGAIETASATTAGVS